MVTIDKRHLSVSLDPDSVFPVLGQVVKTSDVESELSALGELAKIDSSLHKLVLADVAAQLGDALRHVVDSVPDEPEDVRLVGAFNEVSDVVADVLDEFGEEDFGLFVGKGPHQQQASQYYNRYQLRMSRKNNKSKRKKYNDYLQKKEKQLEDLHKKRKNNKDIKKDLDETQKLFEKVGIHDDSDFEDVVDSNPMEEEGVKPRAKRIKKIKMTKASRKDRKKRERKQRKLNVGGTKKTGMEID